jgi:hypothetical protein
MCCGNRSSMPTAASRGGAPKPSARPAQLAGIPFEYTGPTALTACGAITGISYRFTRPGAQLRVDRRDAPAMIAVPHLRRL